MKINTNFLCFILIPIILTSLLNCQISTTRNGQVKGSYVDFSGKKFPAFDGIPYAQPPHNDLRFKPPQPVTNWAPKVLELPRVQKKPHAIKTQVAEIQI
jgi:carboxylesterase type B